MFQAKNKAIHHEVQKLLSFCLIPWSTVWLFIYELSAYSETQTSVIFYKY